MNSRQVEIDGVLYEARVFSGNGEQYDRIWEEGMPVRRNSLLLRQIVNTEQVAGQATEIGYNNVNE